MKNILLNLVYFYQKFISPNLGMRCRFYPSCSHYASQCLHRYGVTKALCKSLLRLLRCQPWSKGGFDYP